MARPRISSGEPSWIDVLVPVTVTMPAKPVTKSIGTAAHAWRTVESPTRPAQATAAVTSSSPTPGSGLARVPRASAPETAPTPSAVIRNPKPSGPRWSTVRARSGTYTVKLKTKRLTTKRMPRMARIRGVRVM